MCWACLQRQHADDISILKSLPLSQMYERSFMHRDTVTHVATATAHDFIVTGSSDGDLRFWKILSVSSSSLTCIQLYPQELCILCISLVPSLGHTSPVAPVAGYGAGFELVVRHNMKQLSAI